MIVLHGRDVFRLSQYAGRVLEDVQDDWPGGIVSLADNLQTIVDSLPDHGPCKVRASTLSDLRSVIRRLQSQTRRAFGPENRFSRLLYELRQFALFELPDPDSRMDTASRREQEETASSEAEDVTDDVKEEDDEDPYADLDDDERELVRQGRTLPERG